MLFDNSILFIFRNLIKTIKRKNTNNNNINEIPKPEGADLMESYQKELSSKKLTKQSLEKLLLNFNKHLELENERQKALELKYEELEKKSEEYYIQNQNLMHEIASRRYFIFIYINLIFKINNLVNGQKNLKL